MYVSLTLDLKNWLYKDLGSFIKIAALHMKAQNTVLLCLREIKQQCKEKNNANDTQEYYLFLKTGQME